MAEPEDDPFRPTESQRDQRIINSESDMRKGNELPEEHLQEQRQNSMVRITIIFTHKILY